MWSVFDLQVLKRVLISFEIKNEKSWKIITTIDRKMMIKLWNCPKVWFTNDKEKKKTIQRDICTQLTIQV